MGRLSSDTGRPVVWLHVGPMKTGTTYLQQLMYANRAELAEAGLVLPGERWSRQVRGVQDVMRLDRTDRHVRRQSAGVWTELLDEATAEPDRVSLISMEFLSFAGSRRVHRVLSSLGDVDVRVLLTVRDMAGALPSQWQTAVHNGGKFSWPSYLDAVPAPGVPRTGATRLRRRPVRQFHRTQNVPRMLGVWRQALPPGALHVVTVPRGPAPPDELWRRVAEVVGIDPGLATRPAPATNESLGFASTELVRRVNRRIGWMPRSEYNWTVKEVVALDHLASRAELEGRATLSRSAYDRALEWNALTRETIRSTGAPVVGDLDQDLPVVPEPEVRDRLPPAPACPEAHAMLDAAEVAATGLAQLRRRRLRRLARAGIEPEVPALATATALRRSWESADDPVEAAAADLAVAARQAAMLLRRIRQERHKGREI